MSKIIEPQILSNNQEFFVTKDLQGNVIKPKLSGLFSDYLKNNPNIFAESSTPVLCKDGTTQNQLSSPNAKYADACINNGGRADLTTQQQAQLQLAKLNAVMQEMTPYRGLTDKVFGKQEGWSFERPMRLGAYIILGAVVGRYVAKNMKKSSTLGMVVGGLAPLLAYQLSIEYDRKNMPKQEPRQKISIEPTPMPNKPTPMPQVKPLGMPIIELDFQTLSKIPNEFTIKSNGFKTRYYKIIDKNLTGFEAFGVVPDLYKQPYQENVFSGVMPTKITTREFLDAYNEFLKQPK